MNNKEQGSKKGDISEPDIDVLAPLEELKTTSSSSAVVNSALKEEEAFTSGHLTTIDEETSSQEVNFDSDEMGAISSNMKLTTSGQSEKPNEETEETKRTDEQNMRIEIYRPISTIQMAFEDPELETIEPVIYQAVVEEPRVEILAPSMHVAIVEEPKIELLSPSYCAVIEEPKIGILRTADGDEMIILSDDNENENDDGYVVANDRGNENENDEGDAIANDRNEGDNDKDDNDIDNDDDYDYVDNKNTNMDEDCQRSNHDVYQSADNADGSDGNNNSNTNDNNENENENDNDNYNENENNNNENENENENTNDSMDNNIDEKYEDPLIMQNIDSPQYSERTGRECATQTPRSYATVRQRSRTARTPSAGVTVGTSSNYDSSEHLPQKLKINSPQQNSFKQRQLELHRHRIAVELKRLELLELKMARERDEMIRERILFEKELDVKTEKLRKLMEDRIDM